MTFWAKRKPLTARSFTPPELDRLHKENFFFVFVLEPLILFMCLIAINCYLFKLRLKISYLRLQTRYLSFSIFKTVHGERHPFSKNVRDWQISEGSSYGVDQAHGSRVASPGLANVQDHGDRGEDVQTK